MEESIRGCYEETIDLTSDRFVKMILLDVIFILELFIRERSISLVSDDPIVMEPRSIAVTRDLLLLENQLPFFVIDKLYELAFPSLPEYDGLLQLTFDYFGYFNSQLQATSFVNIKHFTDLIRTFQLPPLEKQAKRSSTKRTKRLYSATQLHNAGVKFEVGTSKSYFDMKFENGVLKIPSIELNDWMEVVARNIIALEQTRYIENAYFTDYFLFMDSLIRTRKDVDLFCDKTIWVNYLGDSYAAKSMIKNLNKGILLTSMSDDYVDLCQNLSSFYDNPCHKQMTVLKREYFSTPSVATSTIITFGVITVLTLIQTICSILQVKGSS